MTGLVPSSIEVSFLLKSLQTLLFILFVGSALCLFYRGLLASSIGQAASYYGTAFGIAIVAILVGKRSVEVYSVSLTENGVKQWHLFEGKRVLLKKQILWNEIVDISARPGSFLLIGQNYNIEITISAFWDAQMVIEFVRIHSPK